MVDEVLLWIEAVPGPPWRLVLAGRSAPYLATRDRPDRDIRHIGPEELRLDDHRVAEWLRHTVAGHCPQRRALLSERIAGWAAGLEMASTDGEWVSDHALDPLSGSDPRVGEYFERR